MSADLSTYSKELLARMRPGILERIGGVFLYSPEWRAWADKWREAVPLTAEQERANAAWRTRLPVARKALDAAADAYQQAIAGIEHEFSVTVSQDEDGYDIDEYATPHRVAYRTKAGAPPEPPTWPTGGGTIQFRRFGEAIPPPPNTSRAAARANPEQS